MIRKLCIVFVIFSALFSGGCYTIRKKFTRKKKLKKETPVYIDFKEYPQKPSREVYLDYYLFIKGWVDELKDALQRGISFKREKRAINEAIKNLEQIISFYNHEGKEKIYPLYEELLAIRKEIERNPNKSGLKKNQLIKRLEHFKRKFEADFNYLDAEKWLG